MQLPYRRSPRLRGYDYSNNGAYFITIVLQNRECRLGKIENGIMELNDAGRMVLSVWNHLSDRYPFAELDAFAVMPNHIHGIIIINRAGVRDQSCNMQSGQAQGQSLRETVGMQSGQAQGLSLRETVGDIIGAFKSITTNRYIKGVKMNLVPAFNNHLWQNRFYDHIIRNQHECDTSKKIPKPGRKIAL